MNAVGLLKSAANELAFYIDAENARLKKGIQCNDLDDPDYHDHQTCWELEKLATEIQGGIDTNNENQSADDEHELNRFK